MRSTAILLLVAVTAFVMALPAGNKPEKEFVRQHLQHIRQNAKRHLHKPNATERKWLDSVEKRFKRRNRTHINPNGDNIEEINQHAKLSVDEFYQADMRLTEEQLNALVAEGDESQKEKRQTFGKGYDPYGTRKWKTFYYSFDSTLSQKARNVSKIAFKIWNDNTCVNFVESTTASPRVSVFPGSGCWSYVGTIGGVQQMSIGSGCEHVGVVLHETGHALGYWHEQARVDRDDYITVDFNNVLSGWEAQLDKESASMNENYGFPYDYGSIMHYAGDSISKTSGVPAMVAKLTQFQDTMGSYMLSFRDISLMNTFYGCKTCAKNPGCTNGGFPHPRDCTKCLCPPGYGGTLCNQRPTGCGSEVAASTAWQTLSSNVGLGSYSVADEFTMCNWRITAPAGYKIEARIKSYSTYSCASGCIWGGIELKWRADTMLTGTRYCCANDVGEMVTSATNVLPIIGFNRYYRESFSIEHRYVKA